MLLDALLRHRAPMSAGAIARAIDAPRSTTYEIINRLVEAQMLAYAGAEGHVYFGRAMHLFGWAYGHHDAQYRRLVDVLDRLAAESGATSQLCGLRGDKYVVLDCRDAPGPFRITSDVGAEVPIPWTASGRLLLAHLTDDEIRAFIPAQDYRLPDGRVIEVASFLADVSEARRQGFAETRALADRFTWCMAAPIQDKDGTTTATLCLVLPVDTPRGRRAELRSLLRDRAASASLDGRSPGG